MWGFKETRWHTANDGMLITAMKDLRLYLDLTISPLLKQLLH